MPVISPDIPWSFEAIPNTVVLPAEVSRLVIKTTSFFLWDVFSVGKCVPCVTIRLDSSQGLGRKRKNQYLSFRW